MTARDDLIELLHADGCTLGDRCNPAEWPLIIHNGMSPPWRTADAIIAAGWTPPPTIVSDLLRAKAAAAVAAFDRLVDDGDLDGMTVAVTVTRAALA